MSLGDLQKMFLESFYKKEKNFLHYICPHEDLSSQQKFEIYAGSITESLINALRENFPVTEKLVGDEFFRFMAYEYIVKTPSLSPNLGDYGSSFSDFVEHFPSAQCLPYLADVCRLEWYWHRAYSGVNYSPLDVTELNKIDPSCHRTLNFKRCANSYLLKSNYSVKMIWELNQGDELTEEIQLHKQKLHLLIWRPNMEVVITELTKVQWLILQAFDEGLSIEELSEQFKGKADLNAEIPHMFAEGWLTGFEPKAPK
jgi:hypothetical protein